MSYIPPVGIGHTLFSEGPNDPKTVLNNVIYTLCYWTAYSYSNPTVDPNQLTQVANQLQQQLQSLNLGSFDSEAQEVIKSAINSLLSQLPHSVNTQVKIGTLGGIIEQLVKHESDFGPDFFGESKEAIGVFATSAIYYFLSVNRPDPVEEFFNMAFENLDPSQFPNLISDLTTIRAQFESYYPTQGSWLTMLKSDLDNILPQMKNNLP